jgi:tripartite-type tricarboxylate transporter receptor subunit TctC
MIRTFKQHLARVAFPFAVGMVGAFAFGGSVHAAYPDKTVRVIVGFTPGGTTDVIARIMSKELTEKFGHSFVVENRPGAGSNIGAEMVARSAPDGYTLYFVAVTSAINQTLYKNLHFDLDKDFAAIALAAKVPNILVVNPTVPVHSVSELVQYAKANPGKLNFASSGSGTSIHMAGELFKLQAGVDILHVPYKGSAPALTDLIGGQVQMMFDNMPSSLPFVQAGKLRALAVTTKERSSSVPNLPTMAESGFPDFDVSSWFGLIAPAKTSPAIVNALNAAMEQALDKPEVKLSFEKLGAVPAKTTPAEFTAFLRGEVDQWAKVVKASGAKVE